MKKLIYLIVLIVALGLIVSGCLPVVPPAEQGDLSTLTKSGPVVVWVNISGPDNGYDRFDTIQEGVDAVADYGMVYVANGMYNATTANSQQHSTNLDWWFFVIIDKSLDLIGESQDGVILDGALLSQDTINVTRPTCIWISASNVTVENLTIRNFHNIIDYSKYSYGVVSWKDLRNWDPHNPYDTISDVTLDNLKVQDCLASIYFMHTEYPTVKNCIVKDGLADGIWIAMGGINAVVQCNTVINSDDHGIWVGGAGWCGPSCNNAIITDNYIDGAREGGISFVASDGAIISGNTITNVAGENPPVGGWSVGALSLKDGPSNVEAYNNNIYNNDGAWSEYNGTGHGIGIDGTPSNINLHHNNIYDNTGYGIYNYSTVTIDATRNWWGSPTGPHRELPNGKWVGKGDKVSSNIDYKPWSPHPVEFCNDLSLTCTTIQDGTLLTSDGRVITTGYDEWGYDYQAHMFNGGYCEAYRNAAWCEPYADIQLIMKWNDAWLSNMDCDGDGLLDRHYGYDTYIGSGAWLTNHQWGSYIADDGKNCNWDYFVKIVAAPSNATKTDGVWYTANGTEIGPVIWGSFAIIQQVENDPYAGISGLQYSSPCGPGLGKWEGEFN